MSLIPFRLLTNLFFCTAFKGRQLHRNSASLNFSEASSPEESVEEATDNIRYSPGPVTCADLVITDAAMRSARILQEETANFGYGWQLAHVSLLNPTPFICRY